MKDNNIHFNACKAYDFEDLQNLHDSVGFCINYVSNSMRNSLSKIFIENGYDITHAQWQVLMILWMNDGMHQHELTKIIFKEKTTLTRVINTLENKNLLVRVQDKTNKRNKNLYLTNHGKELRNKLTPLVVELNKKASVGFGKTELENLKKYLTKIYSNINS